MYEDHSHDSLMPHTINKNVFTVITSIDLNVLLHHVTIEFVASLFQSLDFFCCFQVSLVSVELI